MYRLIRSVNATIHRIFADELTAIPECSRFARRVHLANSVSNVQFRTVVSVTSATPQVAGANEYNILIILFPRLVLG